MKGLIFLIIGPLFFSLFFSFSVDANSKVKDFFLCSNKKITRTLRVEILPDKSCQTIYTKAGTDKTIASGTHLESCEKILTNVKANLEEAGWKCRKANSVTVQTSN